MSTSRSDLARAAIHAVQAVREDWVSKDSQRVHLPTARAARPEPRHVLEPLARALGDEPPDTNDLGELLTVLATNTAVLLTHGLEKTERSWPLVESVQVDVYWAEHLIDVHDGLDEVGHLLLDGVLEYSIFDSLTSGPVTAAVLDLVSARHTWTP